MRSMTYLAAVWAVLAVAVSAAEVWEQKPLTQWSDVSALQSGDPRHIRRTMRQHILRGKLDISPAIRSGASSP